MSFAGLWSLKTHPDTSIEVLQVYQIAGKSFDEYVYYHSLSLAPRSSLVSKRLLDLQYAEEVACSEEAVRRRIEEDTDAVVTVVQSYHSLPVAYLRLSYLVERGDFCVEARVPWLMFAEECIVGPSDRPRQIQLEAGPVVRRKQAMVRGKSRAQRRVASIHEAWKPDPQLSVITLSSIHHPKPSNNRHKCAHEILADLRDRQARYKAYRSVPVDQQSLLRRTATSHSCVLPSVDPDQTDSSVYRSSEETEKSPKFYGDSVDLEQREEGEMKGKEAVDTVLPAIPENLSEQAAPPSLCRSESPGVK